ncbi:MAG: hypothetical protein FMNOHCHN_03931 [Ignavibacteriaceae bacterium]|nr:hypothetical protein [Ignavibacteriaceae bacterium]
MTLTEYSQKHNLCRKTAWNHFKRGLIRGAYQLPSGKIIVPDEEKKDLNELNRIISLLEDALRRLKS